MVCAKINIHYVGKHNHKCIKIMCTDVSDMQKTISELSQKPGVERVDLNDYASIDLEDWLRNNPPSCAGKTYNQVIQESFNAG